MDAAHIDPVWIRSVNVFLKVLLFLTLGLAVKTAAADPVLAVQYCVESTGTSQTGCFPTLRQAEAFMRANTPLYADVLQSVNTKVLSSGKTRINYGVADQPPELFYPAVYLIDGNSNVTAALCPGETTSDDPYFAPYRCRNEQLLINNYISTYLVSGENCTYTNIATTGGHLEPFGSIHQSWPGRYGWLWKASEQDTSIRHRIEWDIQCAGWTSPDHRFAEIIKTQSFQCRDGFRSRSQQFRPIVYPNVCEAVALMPYILTRTKQCSSCDTSEGNPIITATGNKEYRESDFEWEGLSFARYYSSARDRHQDAGLDGNWSHTFSEQIDAESTSLPYLKKYDGYVEAFDSIDNITYRPRVSAGMVLLRDNDGSGNTAGWRLLRGNETRYFGPAGRLDMIERGSARYQLLYCTTQDIAQGLCAGLGELLSVVSSNGRVLHFERAVSTADKPFRPQGDVATTIEGISSDQGELVAYEYDAQGKLVEATRAGTGSMQYVYGESSNLCRDNTGGSVPGCVATDFQNYLTGVIDEASQRYATYQYDQYGRAVVSQHAGGVGRVRVEYGDSTAVVSLPLGGARTYSFMSDYVVRPLSSLTQGSGTPDQATAYTYADNRVSSRTENGYKTTYGYDSFHEIERKEALNPNSTPTAFGRTIQTDWNESVHQPTERRVYDAADALIAQSTWTYNPRGQALTATQTDPATSTSRTTTTTYCEQADITSGTCPLLGLVTSINGPRTDVADTITYTYYASDDASCASSPTTCPHRKGDLWKVTDALGRITETLAYDGAGRVLSVKDANNVVTDFAYHPRGWLTARKVRGTNNASEADDQITAIEYWPTGLVKKVTQPDGAFTAYTYDAAHRLTDIADNAGNTIHYTLDNAGNRTAEETKDAGNVLRRSLSRVYNQLGQLQTAKDAYNHATGFTYDANGNNQTVTDALSRVADNDYDPLNRLVRTLQDVGGIEAETKFAYDAQDNLTQVTDPKGLDTTYTYNGFSDLTQLSSPDTGVTTYTYDSAGNRKTQTDARNITATYSYDALNRLTGIAYPTSSLDVAYAYDTVNAACLAGETFAVGRLTKMIDGSGNTEYCYDRFGNLTRKRQTTNGQVFELRYAYTKAGQLQALTYPDGAVVDYVRDGQGRTTEVGVTPSGGTRQILLNQATYYPFGPIAGWTYGNGRTMTRTLNQNYQPLAIEDPNAGGLSLGYAFDEVGNLKTLYNADQSIAKAQYGYDALNRLIDVKDGPTGTVIDHYAYDATGNRTSFTNAGGTTNYTYPGTNHRLTNVGATARTYDNVGNTTQIGGTAKEFVYNDANRMSQVKVGGTPTMNYQLSGRGEQVRKYLAANNTYTVYNEAGQWVGDYDAGGNPIQQAIWLDSLPVGILAGATASQKLHYLQPDHLGSPRTVIDTAANTAIWRWDLEGEAFGNTVPNQDPDGNGTAFVFNMRFPGQSYDAISGLNQNGYRDYEAAVGRYSQADPIGFYGAISAYVYANNTPWKEVDLFGLQTIVLPFPPEVLTLPRPIAGPIDPLVMPMSPSDAAPVPWVTFTDPATGVKEQCPGPCEGLLRQLRDHQRKLREYRSDPMRYDNKGFLRNASPEIRGRIINGRINNLENQIRNFENLYFICLIKNGGMV